MPTHEEIVRLHADTYPSLAKSGFSSREKYVVHLKRIHAFSAAARLAEGRTVLDLGCNVGEGSEFLSRTAEKVVGVDVSDAVIAAAKRRNAARPIDFLSVDGVSLPFADDSFDLVTSFQVIEHVVDQNLFLGELCRVLQPEGLAVITTPNAQMRLDPGMAPWNPFHVHEFASLELEAHLRTFFPWVKVVGLFADEPLYTIEINRAHRIRAEVRGRQAAGMPLRLARSGAKSEPGAPPQAPPHKIVASRKSQAVHLLQDAALRAFRTRYGIANLSFREDNASASMDLLAIAGGDAGRVAAAAAILCAALD